MSYINMNLSQVASSHHGNFLFQFQDDAFACWPWDAGYINFRDSVPCGSWALIFLVMTIQDREGLAWVILTFQGMRLGASGQWLQSWLHASSILNIPLIERARREGQINKQPDYDLLLMLPMHISLFNHQGPKRRCDQGHPFSMNSWEVKTLLKAAQRVSVCQ